MEPNLTERPVTKAVADRRRMGWWIALAVAIVAIIMAWDMFARRNDRTGMGRRTPPASVRPRDTLPSRPVEPQRELTPAPVTPPPGEPQPLPVP